MEVVAAVANVMGPVLLVAASGYLMGRTRPISLAGLTDALFLLFVPALVFSTMSRTSLSAAALGQIAAAAVLVCLGSAACAWLVLRAQGKRSVGFLLVSMFGNNANMGMSLCALAFGEQGLALATAYYAVSALLTFSLGLSLAAPDKGHLEMFRVPFVYAALGGLAVRFAGLHVPAFIDTGVSLLGQAAIPVMLFSLGCRLASVRIEQAQLALQASAVRLGAGLLCGLGAVALLGASGTGRAVILLQASMPAAVINFVISERYQRDPELVASSIALSTTLSMVSLPLLLAWLM